MISFPSSMTIVEVGPRDGLQSLSKVVNTDTKVAMINRLSMAGLPVIEITGFTHPKKIPALADAEAVCERIIRRPGTIYRAIVPNARGAERAVATNIDEVVGLITVSNTYVRRNQNMSLDEAAEQAICAFRIADRSGKGFTMALGLSFWCAYEGTVPEEDVLVLMQRFRQAGIRRFYLAASIGLEDPRHVSHLFGRIYDALPDISLGFHVHNLGGRATALTLAAIDAGAQWVEGAICGIGGGIALPTEMPSTGNLATEDLVSLLQDCGVHTGLDADAVAQAAKDIAQILGINPRSYAANGATRSAVRSLVHSERAADLTV